MSELHPDDQPQRFYTWEQLARDPSLWVALLWRGMWKRGAGYMRNSLRHTGRGEDRRKDKLEGPLRGVSKFFRSYATRYASPPIKTRAQKRWAAKQERAACTRQA